jgi:S1-C subfamily serine protease
MASSPVSIFSRSGKFTERGSRAYSLAFIVIAILSYVRSGHAEDYSRLLTDARESTVYIEATAQDDRGFLQKTGSSGVVIDRKGHILTVLHALTQLGKYRPETLKIEVHFNRKDTQSVRAFVSNTDDRYDLLLLRVEEAHHKPMCSADPNAITLVGKSVHTIGFPRGLDAMTGMGAITSEDGPSGNLITDMVLNEGQSGSPVFLDDGTLIGIAKGQIANGGVAVANEYVVIPLSEARSLLPDMTAHPGCRNEVLPEVSTERLEEGTTDSVDLFLIVDDSFSMKLEQDKFFDAMKRNLTGLPKYADIRVCLLTTDVDYYQGSALQWKYIDGGSTFYIGPIFTPLTTNTGKVLSDTFASIGSEWSSDEQAIKSMNLHVRFHSDQGCIRQLGELVVIVLSDENERSVGGNYEWSSAQFKPLTALNTPDDLIATVSRMLPKKIFVWNSIIVIPGDKKCEAMQDAQLSPSFFGTLYAELSRRTDGYVGSICDRNFDQTISRIGVAVSKAHDKLVGMK